VPLNMISTSSQTGGDAFIRPFWRGRGQPAARPWRTASIMPGRRSAYGW